MFYPFYYIHLGKNHKMKIKKMYDFFLYLSILALIEFEMNRRDWKEDMED
ncbi:hypothetical protein bcere0022_34940 [Bacillus cereus Rock3-44]|nr:hypothetical protein bcere0022_34940 [Bacillus cereus Rock3-44]